MPPSRQNEMNPCRAPAKPDGGAAQSSTAAKAELWSWAILLKSHCVTPKPELCGLSMRCVSAASTRYTGGVSASFQPVLSAVQFANGDPGHDKSARAPGTFWTK